MNDLIDVLEAMGKGFEGYPLGCKQAKTCKEAAQALREAEKQIAYAKRLQERIEFSHSAECKNLQSELIERDKRVAELQKIIGEYSLAVPKLRARVAELEGDDCEHEWLSVRQPLTQRPDWCVLCGMPRYQGLG